MAESLMAFALASLLVILTPGAGMLLVLDARRDSWRSAAQVVGGLACGDLLLIALAGLGLSASLAQWPMLQQWLRALGALYVGFLGMRALLRRQASLQPMPAPVRPRSGRLFVQALALTVSNPKLLLFFATFLPLFMPTGSTSSAFYALGIGFEVLNLVFYALLIAALGPALSRAGPRAWRRIDQLSGLALLACAALALWA